VVKAGLCTRVVGMLPTNFSRGRSLMSVGWRAARGRDYKAMFELVVILKER
jgi:hypothetical protein